MDIASLTSAYTSVKVAKDVFSALLQLKIDSESLGRVTDALQRLGQVQDTLFELREQLFALQSKNEELQRELASRDRWEEKLWQYELRQTPGGAVVYVSKTQPQHYVCPSCITKRELQILQDSRTMAGKFKCPSCSFDFPVKPFERASPIDYPPSGLV